MNLSTATLTKKVSSDSVKQPSSDTHKRVGDFRKLCKVDPIDEKKQRSLFSLIEEETSEEEEKKLLDALPLPLPANAVSTPSAPAATSVAAVSASVDLLFEQMASRMVVMDVAGDTQTTFFLDQPQFASSSFFGTEIIIKEFSTAPKAFNIEIISNPAALTLLSQYEHQLLAAFASGHFNFTVHRLETRLQPIEEPSPSEHEGYKESDGKEEQQEDQQS